MYLLLVLLPLLSFLSCGLFGRYIGVYGVKIIGPSCLLSCMLISFLIFYEVCLSGSVCNLVGASWVSSDLFVVDWGFVFDPLTSVMLLVVSFVSFLVHLYSCEYMGSDPHLPRFMSYISLFTFFMFILVTGDNLLQLFVGWEGVGLCSYLLINFWFTRIQANKAAIKAMLVNRVGDLALALGIFICLSSFSSISYMSFFHMPSYFDGYTFSFFNQTFPLVDLICFFLFLGAMGKSAQLGLHTWLPDAMEGPTPVSALIHAATMVTAGVFLLARCSHLFEFAPTTLIIVCLIGSFTSFFAASVGLVQNDLKKVIAYSTCSQLGYMIFACGLSNYAVSVFHLSNHAFFKALLFLGAGSVIHAVSDEQDMRKMGGLRKLLPFTYAVMLIGSLALMGFPFLTGFYSKDVILEVAFAKYSWFGLVSYFLGLTAASMTAFYSIRLLYLTFLSEPSGHRKVIFNAHESPWMMSLPLAVLAFPSIFIGYLFKDLFVGLGSDFWGFSLFILPTNYNIIDAEFLPTGVKLLPLIFSLSGAFLSFYLYLFKREKLWFFVRDNGAFFYTFLNRKWLFDRFYSEYISQAVLSLGYSLTYQSIDRGVIEIFGPFGFVKGSSKPLSWLNSLHGGYLFNYAFLLPFVMLFVLMLYALNFSDNGFQSVLFCLLMLALVSIFSND